MNQCAGRLVRDSDASQSVCVCGDLVGSFSGSSRRFCVLHSRLDCVLAASLVTTGGFARIINIVLPGDGAAVLIALGLLVAVAMGPYVLAEVGEWLGRLLAGGFYVGRGTPPVRQRRRTP